jgi:hypothetical protein
MMEEIHFILYPNRVEVYYSNKTVDMAMRAVNEETFQVTLEAYKLVEDYKKGLLKGRLKEIAATLDEEDNPVIMMIKQKK